MYTYFSIMSNTFGHCTGLFKTFYRPSLNKTELKYPLNTVRTAVFFFALRILFTSAFAFYDLKIPLNKLIFNPIFKIEII